MVKPGDDDRSCRAIAFFRPDFAIPRRDAPGLCMYLAPSGLFAWRSEMPKGIARFACHPLRKRALSVWRFRRRLDPHICDPQIVSEDERQRHAKTANTKQGGGAEQAALQLGIYDRHGRSPVGQKFPNETVFPAGASIGAFPLKTRFRAGSSTSERANCKDVVKNLKNPREKNRRPNISTRRAGNSQEVAPALAWVLFFAPKRT
jgi:hypothetical protein